MSFRYLTIVTLLPALGACGSDNDSAGQASLDAARADFTARCKAAYTASCDKGWACDSFFLKSKYNSAQHCKDDLFKSVDASAASFPTAAALTDCAHTCDTMKADVEAVSCQDFDNAAMKTYKCGS